MPRTFVDMAIQRIDIHRFLELAPDMPILDVRSPGEYQHAHIPGALSFPLFTDEERKVVGTAYKQVSREKAIKIGLNFFGPRMVELVEKAEKILQERKATEKKLLVHCWRGGMRSAGVAWLLDLYGFEVYTLTGGYKAYRHWAIKQFEQSYPLQVVGGYTGSAKTELLQALKVQGEKIIDLEGLANHRGSAFGNLGQPPQPSQEMFENKLAMALFEQTKSDTTKPIWVEDESQRIGDINIPIQFYRYMCSCKVYFLDIPFEKRLDHIVAGYGKFEKERLLNAIVRIKKRLGGLETKMAVNFLIEEDIRSCFSILLKYYDKYYLKSVYSHREDAEQLIHKFSLPDTDTTSNARALLAIV